MRYGIAITEDNIDPVEKKVLDLIRRFNDPHNLVAIDGWYTPRLA